MSDIENEWDRYRFDQGMVTEAAHALMRTAATDGRGAAWGVIAPNDGTRYMVGVLFPSLQCVTQDYSSLGPGEALLVFGAGDQPRGYPVRLWSPDGGGLPWTEVGYATAKWGGGFEHTGAVAACLIHEMRRYLAEHPVSGV